MQAFNKNATLASTVYNITTTNQPREIMKYKNLFNWIEGDDACEVSSIVIESAHDAHHAEEQDFITNRIKSLIETGVTIQSITLSVISDPAKWGSEGEGKYQMELNNVHVELNVFSNVVENLYNNGMSIEHMSVKIDIKEDYE